MLEATIETLSTGNPGSLVALETLAFLKAGIEEVLRDVHEMPAWPVLTDPSTTQELTRAIMAEVYREIAAYQPDFIEATVALIGQFPRAVPAKKIRAMLVHQAEEWDHGEMAGSDHRALEGTTPAFDEGLMPSTAFATAAFWRMLAHKRLPSAYLGALYLFEGLTPIVTAAVKLPLVSRSMSADSLSYIEFHSTEDIKHAKLVDAVITDVVEQYPGMAAHVRFGFEAFRAVYPIPGWSAAYQRALARVGGAR